MSKSAFAMLLEEAQDVLHKYARKPVGLHFDWDGTTGAQSWTCFTDVHFRDGPNTWKGSTGEESLRRLVETLRVTHIAQGQDPGHNPAT